MNTAARTGTLTPDGSLLSPYARLADVLANPRLQAGHTIYLRAGTHIIDTPLHIPAGVTLRPYADEPAVIDQRAQVTGQSCTLLNLDWRSSTMPRVSAQGGSTPTDIDLFQLVLSGPHLTIH